MVLDLKCDAVSIRRKEWVEKKSLKEGSGCKALSSTAGVSPWSVDVGGRRSNPVRLRGRRRSREVEVCIQLWRG